MKYKISTLLALHQDIDASHCKWTRHARDCGLLSPGQRRKPILCESSPNKQAQEAAKSFRPCRNATSRAKSRGRHTPTAKTLPNKPIVTSDEGFARFLQKHSSPQRQRVTAGGRIVPMEPLLNSSQGEEQSGNWSSDLPVTGDSWPSETIPAVADVFQNAQFGNGNMQGTTSGQFGNSVVDMPETTLPPQHPDTNGYSPIGITAPVHPGMTANSYSTNGFTEPVLRLPLPSFGIPATGLSTTVFGPATSSADAMHGQLYSVLLVPTGIGTTANAAQTFGATPGQLLFSQNGDAFGHQWWAPVSPLAWIPIVGDSVTGTMQHTLRNGQLADDIPFYLVEGPPVEMVAPQAFQEIVQRFQQDLVNCQLSLDQLNAEMAMNSSPASHRANVHRRMWLLRCRAQLMAIVQWIQHRPRHWEWALQSSNSQSTAPSGSGPDVPLDHPHQEHIVPVTPNGTPVSNGTNAHGLNPEAPSFQYPSARPLAQTEQPATIPNGSESSAEAPVEAVDTGDVDGEVTGLDMYQDGESGYAHNYGLSDSSDNPLSNVVDSPGPDVANFSEATTEHAEAGEVMAESGEIQFGESMDVEVDQSFSDLNLNGDFQDDSASGHGLGVGQTPNSSQILSFLGGQSETPHTAPPIVEASMVNAYASPGSWAREASREGEEH